jgi:hypothetical protein
MPSPVTDPLVEAAVVRLRQAIAAKTTPGPTPELLGALHAARAVLTAHQARVAAILETVNLALAKAGGAEQGETVH